LILSGSPPDNTYVGQSTTSPFIVSAFGGGSIVIDSVSLSGPNGASYSIVNNTCASGTVVTSSITCEIDVDFAPQQQGPLTEALALTSSVGPATEDISSIGLVASVLVSPTVIDFGFQPVGTTSAPRTLTLKNPNPIPITLPFDYNPIEGDVFIASTTCGTIPANGSCAYQMVFTPQTTGAEAAYFYVVTAADVNDDGDEYEVTQVTFNGSGVQDGASNVTLNAAFNTVAISNDGAAVPHGGLDGHGNAYSLDFLEGEATWSGQAFILGSGTYSGIRQSSISLPTSAPYYGVTLLATGVNSNQPNQSLTVTYADGTSTVLHQSFSDWKTPQHYVGESIAVTSAYRLDVTGAPHAGPYYLYAYTLPLDHTKKAVSLTLPATPNVVALAANVEVAGVPVTAELDGLYNVTAVGVDGETVGPGIDGNGSAISYLQLSSVPLNELLLAVPPYNVPDAVANVTVPLPSGQYSTLHLDGLGVNGNQPARALTIKYQDGTSTVISQGFSDWHTFQQYPRESIAVAMTYKLNPDGSQHPGVYHVYQYDIPIDPTKYVSSVTLPETPNVVILSVALKP
jgi:hypothetical protein